MSAVSFAAPVEETPAAGPKDAEMAALYEKAQTDPASNPGAPEVTPAPAGDPQVPEWLPEKFHAAYKEDPKKALEAVTKSYAELEKGKAAPADDPAPAAEGDPAKATPDEAVKAVTDAGLNFDEFSAEFSQNGELAVESYAKLAAAGIGKETVDAYIAGQQAIAAAATTTIYEAVGGKESYTTMLKWAGQALSPQDVAAYDSAMEGTTEQVLLAVEGLQARYRAANGNEPKLLNGGNSNLNAGEAYADSAQLMADMGSIEYQTSEAFRAKVKAKLARSSVM